MTPSLFYFLLIAVLIAGAGMAGWYFAERTRQYGRVSGSLQSVLYAILLPQESVTSEQEHRDPKDIISVMEHFYAGLSSREEIHTLGFLTDRPSFALEDIERARHVFACFSESAIERRAVCVSPPRA